MALRSDNCKGSYTNEVSTLVDSSVTVPSNPECTVKVPAVFSCQKDNFEEPDDETKETIKNAISEELQAKGCSVEDAKFTYHVNMMGSNKREYPASKLIELGLASNCFQADNDINDASHMVGARCYPLGDVTQVSTGKTVKMYNRHFDARLSTCSLTDNAQVEKDLKNVVAYNMEQNDFKVQNVNDLSCSFYTLPHW